MRVTLSVVAGPQSGQQFCFDGHDTFLVGRTSDCHFKLGYDDPFFSRRHFLIEINPPRCRVLDLKSRNGIKVNGKKVEDAELKTGDEVRAGLTVFQVSVAAEEGDSGTVEHPVNFVPPETTNEGRPVAAFPEIPGFRLDKELGQGGMGVVYRATRESDGERVAIKTIRAEEKAAQKEIDRFLREATILEKLNHANVVKYLGNGSVGSMLYLVMEYVNGPNAQQLVKQRGPMSTRAGVYLMCQALQGLAHAHNLGFVHRDFKPSNLLVGMQGQKRVVKLADFGLARTFIQSPLCGLTMMDETLGTPAFMAPEQITQFRDVLPAADQYSAAATLYWLLTDRFPYDFGGSQVGETYLAILGDVQVPIRERRPDVPEKAAKAIERALSREPRDRFDSVQSFWKELRGSMREGSPPGTPDREDQNGGLTSS